ncbi:hypothetical protein DYB36_004797 [Aphanomyces astaci]|uniref:Uncharacterized protein n=1 Tax=Aphanomyces astaci TaxID=112090 RepID=A0A397B2Q8_APHAT|nr:hypothetical protein DYB36_004797 [Aphanomyces astaci]
MVDHNVTSATDFHNAPRTPPTTVDPKDSNEYEHGFQRRRHRRIAVITAATCLLVVGAVVGVASLSATNPTEVQSSANSKIDPRNSTNITSVPNVVATNTIILPKVTVQPSTRHHNDQYAKLNDSSTYHDNRNRRANHHHHHILATSHNPITHHDYHTKAGGCHLSATPPPPAATTSPPPPPPAVITSPPPPPPSSAALGNDGAFLFQNNCGKTLNLYRSNAFFTSLAPGGSIQVDGTAQRSQMFYFGWDASGDATLFETHFGADNRFYYDISIIPVRCGASWDVCIGPSSFKLPMTVLVRPASGANLQQFPTCKTLSCGDATCPVAYKVPNDVKTMVCPKQVSMTITAC